jgi:hypothetical protein
MYKTLGIAVVLLAAIAFTSDNKPAGASPTMPISAPIVARAKLINQTATIPSTTIFTPTQDGLYRLSVYGTTSKPDPSSQSIWNFNFTWSDDAGNQNENWLIAGYGGGTPGQFAAFSQSIGVGGVAVPFQAKAGMPISYSVQQSGSPDNSAYTIYFALERLE